MLHLYDLATIKDALRRDLEPRLHRLLSERVSALPPELVEHTEYLVIQPGDTEADLLSLVGFSPLVEPMEGIRWGNPGFRPGWDWLIRHDGWFEMIVTFGSTYALILYIGSDGEDGTNDLARLCSHHVDHSAEINS